MSNGLASLPVKRFQKGGFSVGPSSAPASAIGLGGLTSPALAVSTPFGTIDATPLDVFSLAVPAIAPVNTAINALNALAAMNAPATVAAPVSSVEGQIAATVAQEATDAVDAAEGLAAMNAANEAAQSAESAATADAAATAALSDAVSDSVTAANAADAAAAAAAAAGVGGGGGGDAGIGGGAAGGVDGGIGGDGGVGASDGGSSGGDGGSSGERAGGIIAMRHKYAQGGMPDVARQVQSQGRGDDKVLVHMTPREVQGLQYLAMRHGGSLTINPRTGLVEAGFLSSILPMIAGAALTATGVGAPMAAMLVGGATGLATGSLKKGLMAGLGAFGGAGLGAGLSAAGAAAPATTGTAAGLTAAGETTAADILARASAEGIGAGVGPGIVTGAPAAGMVPGLNAQAAAQMFGSGVPGAETFAGIAPPPIAPTTAADIAARANAMGVGPSVGVGTEGGALPFGQTFGGNVQQMGRGFTNIFDFQNPAGAQARQAFLGTAADAKTGTAATGVGGVPGLLRSAGAAAAPMIAEMTGPDQSRDGGKGQAYIRPFKYTPGRQDVTYRTGAPGESTAEQLYFSSQFTPVGVYKAGQEPAYGSYAMGGGINMGGQIDPDYNENVDRNAAFSDDFYGGGLTALAAGGKPNKPRFLMGKGDGMSDSIPATINDTQPARLADGEFVIPADVVSHLGNGSSKAGATKLHAMMNRIRKARTGKKRQAPEVKAERYMPA